MIGRPEKRPSPKHTHTLTHTRVDKTRESGRRVGEKIMALTGLPDWHNNTNNAGWMAATARPWMSTVCWGVPSWGPRVAGYQGRALETAQLLLHGAHARIGPF